MFAKKSTWIVLHRIITVLFILCIVVHVIDVGGIRVFQALGAQNEEIVYERPVDDPAKPTNHVQESDNTQPTPTETQSESQTLEEWNEGIQGVTLADGTYTGSADGYGPDLTVSVVIEKNKIVDIQIIQHNERQERFYALPMQVIPQEIMDGQSLDVDVISGATYTSVGIVNAVRDALSKALLSGELPDVLSLPRGRSRH